MVSHTITTTYTICHSRESGNPLNPLRSWIPAFAGMTTRIGQFEYFNGFPGEAPENPFGF